MTRPERSKQERRIARGREADEAFDRIVTEARARVTGEPIRGGCAFCPRTGVSVRWTLYGAEEADWACSACRA